MDRRLFTSESVTEGHPDKLCDQVSDSILDAMLSKDKHSRVACEAMATTGMLFISGEITTNCYIDINEVVRNTIRNIGYTDSSSGFDADNCAIVTALKEQSRDIALGVDRSLEDKEGIDGFFGNGAGDQGMMFGYACDETESFMPMPIDLAHKLSRRLAEVRKTGLLEYLRPDGKSQVTITYENGVPVDVEAVVISAQHTEDVEYAQIKQDIISKVIKSVIPEKLLTPDTRYFVNATGRFVTGGPKADVGLTGRKIIVDTYGGYSAHGGGCFSGKDPTKVDRSGAYMARYVAKNIVASGLAKRCEVALAYVIGVARPVSVAVNTFDTGVISDMRLIEIINKHFDMRPAAIIQNLDLLRPIYKQTAAYGHFGRNDLMLPWEQTDMTEELRNYIEQ